VIRALVWIGTRVATASLSVHRTTTTRAYICLVAELLPRFARLTRVSLKENKP
jgi:hypothetical protein